MLRDGEAGGTSPAKVVVKLLDQHYSMMLLLSCDHPLTLPRTSWLLWYFGGLGHSLAGD